MARYPDFRTLEGIARRLEEGRGQGFGPNYRPYFTRFDVRSRGERRETYSAKCGRGVHLLSRLEFHLFLLAENDPEVIDIREQFPLPLHETTALAHERDVIHPRYWRTGCDVVMTTDFVFTKRSARGQTYTEAWSGKYVDALRYWRTVEKQRLEEAWHLRKGHRWHLKTEKDLPPIYVSNLAWLHPLKRRDAVLAYPTDLPATVDEVMRRLMLGSNDVLWRVAEKCDAMLGFGSSAISLYICRYLLAAGQWRTDLRSWNRTVHPLQLLQ